jgi:DNA-binding CsgD family transcriptional regulator
MGTNGVKDRARSELARLAAARCDNDAFRWEAASILRHAIGFDGWCWMLADPWTGLPTRDVGENVIIDRAIRCFVRRHPDAWGGCWDPSRQQAVTVTSAVTGRDLARDLAWRETFGPAGVGDHLSAWLVVDRTCWARLHIHRDSSGEFFSADDAEFVAGVAPMLAARIRDGLRARPVDDDAPSCDDPAPEPGTIIVDEELSLVAATQAAWDWIDRLGLPRPNDAEPLPGFIYAAAVRMAISRAQELEPPPIRVRLQAADGHWVVARAAPLICAAGGYVITLEAARSEDLTPLLMRAWSLTAREREVARLVIDGLSSDDIARALFISAHTVRDHVKAIFAKIGITRRQDLVGALAGAPRPTPVMDRHGTGRGLRECS